MRLILMLLLAAFLNSCSNHEPLFHAQHYVFGTLVDISIYGETESRAEAAVDNIIQQYTQLHQRLHAWQPSEMTAVNKGISNGETIAIKPDIAQMLKQIVDLSKQSDGLFNPAIGQLVNTWGFHTDQFVAQTINHSRIEQLVADNPQMSDLTIANNLIGSSNPSVQLDLGGYAKGYALDLGIAYLRAQGIEHALINIGGNIMALGLHGNKPWKVGIQHPRQPNAMATVDLLSGWAIGTSGDYQRYFELDGKRYCHIINPNTGYPTQGIQSVTVMISPQEHAGTLSDVLSKPLFIAAKKSRLDYAKKMQIEHFLIIEDDTNIQISHAMAKQLKWLVQSNRKNIEVVRIDE